MIYLAEINIMPLKSIADAQGKLAGEKLKAMGFGEVQKVRIGKHIMLEIEAESKQKATEKINEACNTLLANPVTEGFEYIIKEKG